ncbi:MAG TPA: hypothetical protein PLJ21_02560 [Pseudobdellovibrionaceae bacterium]|nr:hypothetical protein [Pseudobdellovibrionaceae bacterium]
MDQKEIKELNIDLILSWLDVAERAPSGGNAQPWSVSIVEESKLNLSKITLKIDQEYKKNPSMMDLDGAASVMALGAFVETLDQVANLDGFKVNEIYFNHTDVYFDGVVEVLFSINGDSKEISLEEKNKEILNIKNRRTNRNIFLKKEIPKDFLIFLKQEAFKANIQITLIDEEREELISQLSRLDKIRWQYEKLRDSLFDEISLEMEKSLIGIPIHQLGLNVLDVFMFTLMKKIKFLRYLTRWGLSWVIQKKSIVRPLRQASLFAYLSTSEQTYKSNFNLGRLFQKVWLESQRREMGFQPFCGHLLAYYELCEFKEYNLNLDQKKEINSVAEQFQNKWNLNLKNPLFGFRIGYPKKPGTLSPRKSILRSLRIKETSVAHQAKKVI